MNAAPVAGTQKRVTPLAVGVVVWLASELMFFAGLFAAYFVLRSENATWPTAGADLDVVRAALFTGVLVVSSFTMHKAVQCAEQGHRTASLRWLLLTVGLGAIFLVNEALEWAELDFTWTTDAYGSIFFLLTGFHGLHVFGGLLLMGFVASIVYPVSSKAPAATHLEVTSYYWHFVDVVWVAVFLTIYVIQ